MSRLTAATLLVLLCFTASFGAELWLSASAADDWDETGTIVFVVWCFCLVFPERGE